MTGSNGGNLRRFPALTRFAVIMEASPFSAMDFCGNFVFIIRLWMFRYILKCLDDLMIFFLCRTYFGALRKCLFIYKVASLKLTLN